MVVSCKPRYHHQKNTTNKIRRALRPKINLFFLILHTCIKRKHRKPIIPLSFQIQCNYSSINLFFTLKTLMQRLLSKKNYFVTNGMNKNKLILRRREHRLTFVKLFDNWHAYIYTCGQHGLVCCCKVLIQWSMSTTPSCTRTLLMMPTCNTCYYQAFKVSEYYTCIQGVPSMSAYLFILYKVLGIK